MEKSLEDSVLVVGGDGRFFMDTCTSIIIQMCAANRVSKLIVGQGGFLSTPAVSNLIRKRKTSGGFIMTASHNPGGPDADFGLKFNCANGGPAPDAFTNKIFENTKTINKYKICPDLQCDFNTIGVYEFLIEENFKVLMNSLHGATGPYVEKIFLEEFKCDKSSCVKTNVLPDFGGGHP